MVGGDYLLIWLLSAFWRRWVFLLLLSCACMGLYRHEWSFLLITTLLSFPFAAVAVLFSFKLSLTRLPLVPHRHSHSHHPSIVIVSSNELGRYKSTKIVATSSFLVLLLLDQNQIRRKLQKRRLVWLSLRLRRQNIEHCRRILHLFDVDILQGHLLFQIL